MTEDELTLKYLNFSDDIETWWWQTIWHPEWVTEEDRTSKLTYRPSFYPYSSVEPVELRPPHAP